MQIAASAAGPQHLRFPGGSSFSEIQFATCFKVSVFERCSIVQCFAQQPPFMHISLVNVQALALLRSLIHNQSPP